MPLNNRMTATELSRKYGLSRQAVSKKMFRHGFGKDAFGRYSERDFMAACAVGHAFDKRQFALNPAARRDWENCA